MTLQEFLKSNGETVAGFADRIGASTTAIRKITYGQRQPSLNLAIRITNATGGKVTSADMALRTEAA